MSLPNINSIYYGSKGISFLGPKIGSIVPSYFKDLHMMNCFKRASKNWQSEICPCKNSCSNK